LHWKDKRRTATPCLNTHDSYYRLGLGESPIYFSYNGNVPKDAESFVVFLNASDAGIQYSIEGGAEALDKREEIEALLKARAE